MGPKCCFQDICHVTHHQSHTFHDCFLLLRGCFSIFCFQGFCCAEETVCLGVQKRKRLGRGSITSPILVKQKSLQVPHHNSSLHLFLLPNILPQSKSFLPAGYPSAIALGMACSTQNTFVILSALLTLSYAKSSWRSKGWIHRNMVYVIVQSRRNEVWICSPLSCFWTENHEKRWTNNPHALAARNKHYKGRFYGENGCFTWCASILRYLQVWLFASFCISLLANLGFSSVYETNLFLHQKKKRVSHLFCSAGKTKII